MNKLKNANLLIFSFKHEKAEPNLHTNSKEGSVRTEFAYPEISKMKITLVFLKHPTSPHFQVDTNHAHLCAGVENVEQNEKTIN